MVSLVLAACGDDAPTDPVDASPDTITPDAIDAPIDTPTPTDLCTVTPGDNRRLLTGTVLTPTGVLANGQVLIDAGGMITCVGASCGTGGETTIACPMGVISPGLINTHDHITFTQNRPYTDTGERYEHRHDWRLGRRGHTRITTPGNASQNQVRWGELRFLLAGGTSIVGSGGAAGLLRNLDQASNQEGLGQPAVRFETFPLDDSSGTQLASTCNYGTDADTAASIAGFASYEPHVSEGIDAVSRNEFLCTSSETYDTMTPGLSHDLVQPQTAMIHGIGLRPFDYGVMALDGTALIWSPRSNITLYGDTAPAQVAARMGVQIALGTDWTATGSMNLLRELACADFVNQTYWDGFFTDEQLWQMVTSNAAAVTATDDVIGALAVGRVADIAIFDGRERGGYRAVIEAEPSDVALVMRGGEPLYGEDRVIAALVPTGCDALDVCGNPKRVCLMGEIGQTYAQLEAAVGDTTYEAFFCGTPQNEPSCVARRPTAVMGSTVYTGVASATDNDGDGIANAQDNCPEVFNPVRPVDDGRQGNADSDAAGDACDVCPMDADTTTCTVIDPNDRDGDGVVNGTDNCPDNANPTQADGDGDNKGDACDACPGIANPGSQGCPVSIYSIKNGATMVGAVVRVENAIVTGEGANGFFVQHKATLANGMPDPLYMGENFSGLFVFTGAASPFLGQLAVGNRVTIDGTVTDFFGQIELDAVSNVTVLGATVEAAPAPVVATAAEVTTGGTRARQLEGVLVRIGAAAVSAVNTAQNEFTVMDASGTVIVDDFLFLPSPAPTVGQTFASVTGILAFRNNASKLEPRGATDLPPGMAVLTGFGPSPTFVNAGGANVPTFPTPLTVTLNGVAAMDTMVTVTSSNNMAVMVVGGGVLIPMGQSSGQVSVVSMTAGTATLTATLGTASFMATVRALDGTEQPSLVSLSPATAMIPPMGMLTLTVTLDLPAPAGGTVVNVALAPGDAGTVPATVTVPQGQISTTFVYTHAGAATSATITASRGAASFSSTVSIVASTSTLVINELDYDQTVNPDSMEYIELYNPTAAAVSLAGVSLVLVNGNTMPPSEYKRIDLAPAGTIAAGGYLVIGAAAVTSPPGTKYTPPVGTGAGQWPATDAIQNGGAMIAAPGDGVVLVNTTTMTILDRVAYESAITGAAITGFGTVDVHEGTAAPALGESGAGGIARLPNGADTNSTMADWAFTSTPTPGAANVP